LVAFPTSALKNSALSMDGEVTGFAHKDPTHSFSTLLVL
jgi:hypothetical protein